MFVAKMSSHRINIAGGDLLSGTPDEEAEAEETFLAYCGPYDFEGDKVIHHIEICSFPNWSGVDQERLVELGENRVTLSTHPVLMQCKERTEHLIWERTSTSEQEALVHPRRESRWIGRG